MNTDIKKNTWGTYCLVTKELDRIYKQLQDIQFSAEELRHFTDQIKKYYRIIGRYINLPTLKINPIRDPSNEKYLYSSEENYCGNNFVQLIELGEFSKAQLLIEATKCTLYHIPEGIMIDAHPRNFTLYAGKIYFVDIIPPLMTLSPGAEYMKRFFPIFRHNSMDQLKRRIWRYSTSRGRESKYNYYLRKITATLNPQRIPPQPTVY